MLKGGKRMFKHYITKYTNSRGEKEVASWLQINLCGKPLVFSIKRQRVA